MNLPPLDIRALLREGGILPKKSLGQNFLIDSGALRKIVEAAGVTPEADVLEVGPGLGSLTRYLSIAARQVIAVELDGRMIPVLKQVLESYSNVRVVQGDILDLDPAELMGQSGYRVVANIPYYITSALIRHLLETPLKPSYLVLTVQREVAERICARPGDMSLLALSVQVYGKPEVVCRIPAGAFYPAPNVDSSTLRVELFPQSLIAQDSLETFFKLAKAGFGQKRKTLRNALSTGLKLPAERIVGLLETSGIDPQRRAETLSMEEWKTLVKNYRE